MKEKKEPQSLLPVDPDRPVDTPTSGRRENPDLQ